MAAGADCLDDMHLLRAGALGEVLGGIRAPSTLGTFLRKLTIGSVAQLGKIHRLLLVRTVAAVPAWSPIRAASDAFTGIEKKLGDEIQVVDRDVTAAHAVYPSDGLIAAADEPQIDVKGDVCSGRRVAGAELGQRCRARRVVKREPYDIEQVGALLRRRAVHHRLELHRDDRTGLGDRRFHLHAIATRPDHLDGDLNGGVVRPCVRGRVEAVAGIVARLVEFCLPHLQHVYLDLTIGSWQQDTGGLHDLRALGRTEHLHVRRTSSTAWTAAAIASPRKITRLPDTDPPRVWPPCVEDLASASLVLRQIERDEQRMRQRPPPPLGQEVDTTDADGRHRCDPHRSTRMGRRRGDGEERRRAPKYRLIGDEEVKQLVSANSDRRTVRRSGGRFRQRPPGLVPHVTETKTQRSGDTVRIPWIGERGEIGAPHRPALSHLPEQPRVRDDVRSVDKTVVPQRRQHLRHRAGRPAEMACRDTFGDDRLLILRPHDIIGQYEDVGPLLWWLDRMRRGGPVLVPAPDRAIQPIDVRDVSRFIVDLVQERATGTINVAAPAEGRTYDAMVRACAEVVAGDTVAVPELVWVDEGWLADQGVRERRTRSRTGAVPSASRLPGVQLTRPDDRNRRAALGGRLCGARRAHPPRHTAAAANCHPP